MQFLHVINGDEFDVNVWLVIAFILRFENKVLKLCLEVLELRPFRLGADGEVISFLHCSTSRYVLHPLCIVDNIGNLDNAICVDLSEYSEEQGNMLDHQFDTRYVYAIAYVIGVFNEDEDERA